MKLFIIGIAAVAFMGLSGYLISSGSNSPSTPVPSADNNVVLLEGKQVVTITAKGGYAPRTSVAQANTPTILKIITKGTFDCSSSLVIPNLNYRTNLPPSGETLVEVPPQQPGTTLQGLCSMGMYNFTINFN